MRKIRIFISSPSDVRFERNIARNVINELNSLYAKYAKLEVLMWEDFPLSANATFQEGINYFLTNQPIDIAVFILWTRLGTPLCTKFLKKDGSPYKSGTEYEFDLMMRLHEESASPSRILTYIKQDERYPAYHNYNELRELISQKERLDCFLKEYFRDDQTNSNYAYLSFGEKLAFEQVFRTHLTGAIKDLLGEIDEVKEWDGNPYVGLNSFEFDQHSIFFGRKQLIHETASKLISADADHNYKNSLIVLGESGSGKSSFVKAGLLPFFCNRTTSSCECKIITPSMFTGQVYNGLLDLLESKYEFLHTHPFMEELRKGISNDTNFNYLNYALENYRTSDWIIYIDQFEELFSDNQITDDERRRVLLLLRGIIKTRKMHVFMSMRSDFYNRFSIYEEMAQIKESCELVDLPVMGVTEIAEIVEEPAKKACLRWEIDDKGVGLNRRIIMDAGTIKDLPLIEFALSELYLARDEKDVLTIKTYEEMGGLKGAIVNYANKVYLSLSEIERKTFEDILGFIVTESASAKGTYVRKTSLRDDAEKTTVHKSVILKMLDARLFVAGKDAQGKPTITITHEILLKSWDVLSKWIEKEKEYISSNRHYEQLAQHWVSNGKQKKDLVHGRSPQLEVEYFHFKNSNRIADNVSEYLNQSIKIEKRSGLVWRVIVAAVLTLSVFSIFISKLSGIDLGIEYINNASILDLSLCYVSYLIILYYSIYLRIKSKPEYKTIGMTVVVWSVSALMTLIYSCTGQPDFMSVLITALIYFLPVFVYLTTQMFEYTRRKRWHKQYVPYVIRDDFWTQFSSIFWAVLVSLVTIFVGAFYYIASEEKNDALESRAVVADELFDGLDNIRDNLSYADYKYVNEMRRSYLIENFSEELLDEVGDDRDLEYARVLYNLKEPYEALDFLHPDERWDHHVFWIKCAYSAGLRDEINSLLDEYVQEKRFDQISNNFSTANLIWRAEILGRFDCAEILDKTVSDTLDIDYLSNPVNMANKGHIYLSKGLVSEAMDLYNSAISLAKNMGYVDANGNNLILDNIKNDLHVFSRFNLISESVLRNTARMVGVDFIPAFVPLDKVDVNESNSISQKLQGDWECYEDNVKICLNVNAYNELFTYVAFDSEGVEFYKSVNECRFGRVGGDLLWDEFDLYSDYNSAGKLLELEDDHFILEIVENGNPEDKGKIRRYTRVMSEE